VSVGRHRFNNMVGSGVDGPLWIFGLLDFWNFEFLEFLGNDSEFYMATSLYRSVDGSRLSLIREPQ
jgi:hypothetical protein